jgi:microcystin degradation protein MlrC
MPCLDIYTQLAQLESSHDVLLSFNPCFPTSDTAYTSPTVLGYGADATLAVQQLTHFIEQQQANFATQLYSEQQAVDYFKAQHQLGNTFIFADTQDNSGCGGTANTMGIFNCLLANNIQNAAVAIICDPQAVVIAAQHNIEDCFELTLGDAFTGRVTLKRLTDGQFVGTGDFYKDFHINLGPMALLEYRGISLLVSSKKMQAADQAVFRHLGLEANAFDLLVLKSSVHFRADFSALAQEIIIVESPGENVADLNKLTYTKCLLKKM